MDKEQPQYLTISDLENVNAIIDSKVRELKLVDKSKGPTKQTPEQEHKAVSRVLKDVIEILLSNIEVTDALPVFQSVFGRDFSGKPKDEAEAEKVASD